MDKEELLLKNFSVLSKDVRKNSEAVKSALQQLIEINPKLGIRCWDEIINSNMSSLETELEKPRFEYGDIGYIIVRDYEDNICGEDYFVSALEEFAKDKSLLEVLYTKSPIYDYFSGKTAISYLIRKSRLQEADSILSAIYKNKSFDQYAEMWNIIIGYFEYGDKYRPGASCII